jgi:hypothetical protein
MSIDTSDRILNLNLLSVFRTNFALAVFTTDFWANSILFRIGSVNLSYKAEIENCRGRIWQETEETLPRAITWRQKGEFGAICNECAVATWRCSHAYVLVLITCLTLQKRLKRRRVPYSCSIYYFWPPPTLGCEVREPLTLQGKVSGSVCCW